MNHCIVVEVLDTVPIGNHTVDSGDLHQERVVLQHVGSGRIVRTDQRIEVRGDGSPAIRVDLLGIKPAHRPVPAPGAAYRFRLEPWHVVNQQQWPLLPVNFRADCGGDQPEEQYDADAKPDS